MHPSPTTKKILLMTAGTAAVAAGLVLVGSHELPWTDRAEAVPLASQHHTHNHEGLTWPPQPRGITNVTVYSTPRDGERTLESTRARRDRLEQKAQRGVFGLGTRLTQSTVLEQDAKPAREEGSETAQAAAPRNRVVNQMVMFSHDRNATVEVGFDAEEAIETVTFIPANEYQPEITDEESAEAAQVARAYFLRQGFHRVAGLRAYGILAYKPEGTGFYDTRVIYVSFHAHDDAPPQLMAWVDLTNQRVLQIREER